MESGIRPAAEPIAPRPLEEAPDWLKELSPENTAQAETIEESVDEAAKLVESQPETMDEDLGSVDWLDSESEEAVETSPTIEPTWMPANEMGEQNEEPQAEAEPMMSAEEREPVPPVAQPATAAKSAPAPEPVAEPQGAKRQGGVRRRTTLLDPEQVEDRLGQARQALSYGNIGDAVEAYGYMLRRRIRLDEVIADLRAALRRFPRQVTLWQALGDAYMRNNQLKDALECYTKAETLL
jgi:tetratricopeptide (TPR) repeat protein